MDAKKYNNIKIAAGIFKGITAFSLLLLFVWSGFSSLLADFIGNFIESRYIAFVLFLIAIGAASSVIFFPLNFYTQYYLEHKYHLSNQRFFDWIWEGFKSMLVGGAIGIPILLIFYFLLISFGSLWWLPFAMILFIVSVLIARIVPVVILPLFYKIDPLEDSDLKERILILAQRAGMKVENVYQFNMSKNTKKANAAFAGLGSTKRILLGDTLLKNFGLQEVESVIAHELGHYKRRHILKNIIIGSLSSFLTLFIIAYLYETSIHWFGFGSITDIAALPLLSLWGMIVGIIQTPLSNAISRKFEYEADEYAVTETAKPAIFIDTLKKITDQNLGDPDPHPLVEWYFYSHPSINNRKAKIKGIML